MSDSSDDDLERLKRLAGRLDDLFELPVPDAPGMVFAGARFHAGQEGRRWDFSAGACDADRERAFRRCVGEAAETLAQFSFLHPAYGNAVPAWRVHDDAPASVPAKDVFRDVAGARGEGMSLGCSAGRSREEAALSALLELVERDAVALWWEGGHPPRRLDPADTPDDALAAMRAGRNHRATVFLDVTTDLAVPVVAAISFDGQGRDFAAGFAARPSFHEAAAAALRELAQMELGNRLVGMKLERLGAAKLSPGEAEQLRRMREIAPDDMRLRLADPAGGGARPFTVPRVARELAAHLAGCGQEVACVDLTVAELAIAVVKALAPGLQAPGAPPTPRLLACRKSTGFDRSIISNVRVV